jgi:hypothetical protein
MAHRKITIAARINEMLAAYEALNGEAHEIIDRYFEDALLQSSGSIRQLELTNRAGFTLNIPEALRILRQIRL